MAEREKKRIPTSLCRYALKWSFGCLLGGLCVFRMFWMFSKRFLRILDGLPHLHSLFAYFRRAVAPTFAFLRILGALAYLHLFLHVLGYAVAPMSAFYVFRGELNITYKRCTCFFVVRCRRNRALLRFFCRTGTDACWLFHFLLVFNTARARFFVAFYVCSFYRRARFRREYVCMSFLRCCLRMCAGAFRCLGFIIYPWTLLRNDR